MDEWTLVCGSLALVSTALAVSACGNYYQHTRIQTLTTERDTAIRERDARPESLWKGFLEKVSAFTPFLCIKKELITPEQTTLLTSLGYSKSQRKHKVPGLTTFISNNPDFTDKEKNMVSDEEDALDERDQLLEAIGSDIEELNDELEHIGEGTTHDNE